MAPRHERRAEDPKSDPILYVFVAVGGHSFVVPGAPKSIWTDL